MDHEAKKKELRDILFAQAKTVFAGNRIDVLGMDKKWSHITIRPPESKDPVQRRAPDMELRITIAFTTAAGGFAKLCFKGLENFGSNPQPYITLHDELFKDETIQSINNEGTDTYAIPLDMPEKIRAVVDAVDRALKL